MMLKRFIYSSFKLVTSLEYWLYRRFTLAGIWVLGVLGASAVLGLDTNRTMTYQIFTFLLSILTLSFLFSLFYRGRFSVQRRIPNWATAGVPLKYRFLVKNEMKKVQQGLVCMESLLDPRPSFEEFSANYNPDPRASGRPNRNRIGFSLKRFLSKKWIQPSEKPFPSTEIPKSEYRRWQWMLNHRKIGRPNEQGLPVLAPGAELEVRSEILPLKRGRMVFESVLISRPDPLGLVKSVVTLPLCQSVWVLPKRYHLPNIQLPGLRKFQQGGVALSSSIGDSEEFVSLRDYRPGDPLQRIHWKSWARMGKPIVKEYQEEFFIRHALILDTFSNLPFSDVFEEAVSIAASFVTSIETMESLLDLIFVGTESYCFTSGRGQAGPEKMLEILASVKLCADKQFKSLQRSVMDRAPALSGCICVLLAWNRERMDLIAQLRALGVPVIVFVMCDAMDKKKMDLGPMADEPEYFHALQVGKIQEGLARL